MSEAWSGGDATGESRYPSISADGRYAGFFSNATDLLPPGEDTNGSQDVFIAYGPATIFADGFETGETSRFSSTVP